ncbi:hypothetical protein PAXRUDRAFT_165010, partial [Paxillus rubicundulus Ve08.2h10]
MEIYTNLLPIEHRLQNLCQQAAVRLASHPPAHPLQQLVCHVAKRYVKHHNSSLHHLFHAYNLPPDDIESIANPRHSPSSTIPFQTRIAKSREDAIFKYNSANDAIRIYCDGSGVGGRIGAAAVLQRGSNEPAEAVGLTLAVKLLATEKDPPFPVSIYVDNQAVITSGENILAKPGHYILGHFHRLI